MVEKLNVIGRLTRVETKFAFIETTNGSVFCPLAAAIPPSEHVPNFSLRYKTGDIVHVTMVPQEGKNGCIWRAIKVRPLSSTVMNDKCCDENLKIAPNYISSHDIVNENKASDAIQVTVHSQDDKNGCKWIATSATKLEKQQEPLITGRNSLPNSYQEPNGMD
ncbi:hypothetical protein DICVIV_10933 [Dictyocaulus viviparus]|uniref:Uncharacterized protein n=1 Tax=Dictyocaulus viviparus TaxID=29172 RepID=A0A0D8XEJ0_DICVI|nr:hypothetical protein DICVIV_10933 [Dictyocaulus viviparus]